uniref:Uncharacterized protein n=1 Tax=Anguilla anguilla TaxID=7936 RepID=A0A0E9W843_ANGAN
MVRACERIECEPCESAMDRQIFQGVFLRHAQCWLQHLL